MLQKLIVILVILVIFQIVSGVNVTSCYQCNSSETIDCINDLTKIKPNLCEGNSTNYCITSVGENGLVTRDCSKEPCSLSDTNCKSIDKDNGNNHNICQTCNSSTDPKCAQSENVVMLFNKVCEANKTECFINIKDKNTIRGCATADDLKACNDANICKKCSGANCNSGVFPTNRLYCFQCSDDKCNNVIDSTENIKSLPCQFYDSNDKCYTFGTSSTAKMLRGCVSDSPDKDNKCSSPDSNELCATCDIAHCNNQNYMRDQSLRCIQCTSSPSDNRCMWGMNSNEAKNCQNKIEYYKKEMCYTQLKDGVVYRGCYNDRASDLGKCKDNCTTCEKSNGDGCNNKDKANFTCIRCRSDDTPNCYDNADKINGTACRTTVKYEESGCFHGMWNGVVIRGCIADADERLKAICKDLTNHQCNFCNEKDCNNKKTTSAASSFNAFGTLFLIGVFYLMEKI